MNAKPDLLPCPYCGAEAYIVVGTRKTVVACSRANLDTHRVYYTASTKEEAVALWNTRARLKEICTRTGGETS